MHVAGHELGANVAPDRARVQVAGNRLDLEGRSRVADVDVPTRGLDPGGALRPVQLEITGGGLDVHCAVLAASTEVGGLRPDIQVRAVGTADAQADVGAAEADVGSAVDRDEDAAATLCLHHDLVSVAAPDQLDTRVVDEIADRVVVRDGLELHARLVRVPGLDLDLPGGNLEVQAQRARSGIGLAAHQRM